MADESKAKKKPSKKFDNKKLSYIFFSILIIGIIIVTLIVYIKFTNKKYTANFGENITTTIELNTSENNIEMTVKVGATEVKQHGTIQQLDDGKDEDGQKWIIYEATLEPMTEEEEPEVVQIKVYDKSLILAYSTGETVEYTR